MESKGWLEFEGLEWVAKMERNRKELLTVTARIQGLL